MRFLIVVVVVFVVVVAVVVVVVAVVVVASINHGFLSLYDNVRIQQQWKAGKRKAEKDELISGMFFSTIEPTDIHMERDTAYVVFVSVKYQILTYVAFVSVKYQILTYVVFVSVKYQILPYVVFVSVKYHIVVQCRMVLFPYYF